MTALQVALLVTTLVGLSCSQVFNGYINPLFLPRGLRDGYRRGRVYDPYGDLRDNGYYLSRGGAYQDYDYRRLPLDIRYDNYRRYPSQYDDYRRFPSQYDDYRRYPTNGLDNRYNDVYRQYPDDFRYQSSIGLATTSQPLDRGQVLDRGQILSSATPGLAVTVQPNGSAS